MVERILLCAILALPFSAVAEQLYKCQSADGGITYSNEPCPKSDTTVKKIAPGDTSNFTIVPSEVKPATVGTEAKSTAVDNKKCAAYGDEIRDIDSRLSHGFVGDEGEKLKARRKELTDIAYKECFSEQR